MSGDLKRSLGELGWCYRRIIQTKKIAFFSSKILLIQNDWHLVPGGEAAKSCNHGELGNPNLAQIVMAAISNDRWVRHQNQMDDP